MGGLIASILLVGATQLPPAAPPQRDGAARDTSATPTATGIIRGRVTDKESGQPLARALVTLVSNTLLQDSRLARRAAMSEPRSTLTAADGRYELRQVPAGTYVVIFDPSAMRGTHLRQYFGEVGPADDADGLRPPPLTLADGEVRNDVDAALFRSLAIEGRVLDDLGEPMANVGVSVHPSDGLTESWLGSRSTDDRGAFRLFGLKPGHYRVCAHPEGHSGLPADVRDRPIRTCYPSSTSDANAEPVALLAADVAGVDIRVQRNRAFKVTGTALDSKGSPLERAIIELVALNKNNSSSGGIELRDGGQFIARTVTPGEYAVRVHIGSLLYDPEDKRETEFGYALVDVDNADVEGIVVTTAKLAKASGLVTFEDGTAADARQGMRVSTEVTTPVLRAMGFGYMPSAELLHDSTFELTAFPGPQFITVTGQPPGWVIGSIKYGEDDVTDRPVELRTSDDPSALQITMTRRGASVSGRVLDPAGKKASAAYALLISTDPLKRRSGLGIVKTAIAKPDGSFSLGPVRAGAYVIVAGPIESPVSVSFPESEELERVFQAGERIVLVEGEKREIDLRIVKPQ